MEKYIEQHKRRLNYMPWLYYSLKEKHLLWAKPWQEEIQKELTELETVKIGENCFISSLANIFAEPGRDIIIGNNVSIGAETFLHGPIIIEDGVSINAGVYIDGGAKGVIVKKNTRIANGTKIYAFNHGISLSKSIKEQTVTSKGITIGSDVWIGANVCIVDGVSIENQAVIGMGSVVTKNIPNGEIFAGNPAKKIGKRN
ncbi:acyltransferase [Pigmentibacter sp. JX0631]|nr:acyltransferase [Pigmentibacter sp. JX0631]WGL60958.1 acyltransferase [Pigmentibacter sp. JX0631]